jgi:RND superfamily putative drug exporter
VISTLDLAQAKGHTDELLRAIGRPAGARAYVTGAPAIQHDLDPIFNDDLRRGEAIALPIALLVLLAVFGLSLAVTIPFLFAACTVFGTLGIVYVAAHYMTTPTYVTNLVFLIGIGIAIDYSLLIVYRFREELGHGLEVEEAVLRTMETAGRAVIVSGFTVAIGLALLLFMPLPFMRAMGVGGFLIPIVSILAAATLQPALLAIYGRRGTHRAHVASWLRLPVRQVGDDVEHRFWARLARSIMRHKWLYVAGVSAALVAGAIPVGWLQLTPGATAGIRSRGSRCSRAPSAPARSPRRRCSWTAAGRAGLAPPRSRPRSRGSSASLYATPRLRPPTTRTTAASSTGPGGGPRSSSPPVTSTARRRRRTSRGGCARS